ncbi:MAG: SIR2 family protein [Campylobacterales bacterium]|nr:SIR2 family protein [Campylobacterales bacterium]
MSFDIKPIPDLLPEIKESASSKKLAIFVGAGISRFVDCTSWWTLAENLTKKCEKEGLINHSEQQMLAKNPDMKKVITICNHLLGNDDRFMEEMKKSLNDNIVDKYRNNLLTPQEKEEYEQKRQIYNDLFSLNAIFITTNADRHVDVMFHEGNIIYKKDDFKLPTKDEKFINPNRLYKIHGSIVDKESLVFTVDQYLNRYTNDNFNIFLKSLFTNYYVLFVGYGLSEFELLDYLFKSTRGDKQKHFFLKDYFSYEKKLYEFEQMYFGKLGITLIPYEKDQIGFEQLRIILSDWADKIKKETTTLDNVFDDIDEALGNPDD